MTKTAAPSTATLSKPVKIDGKDVSEITLRKPATGEMRGLSLVNILQMDINTMIKLLPRISNPPLNEQQVAELELEDFTELAGKTVLFFAKKEQLEGVTT